MIFTVTILYILLFFVGIRNDLKAIMDRIEKSLNAYFTQGNGNESDMVNGHCSLKPDH